MTKGDKVNGKKGHIMGAKGRLEASWLKVINQMIKRDGTRNGMVINENTQNKGILMKVGNGTLGTRNAK